MFSRSGLNNKINTGFLYVIQVFIRQFPPEKISLFHANAPLPPSHTTAGSHADHRVVLQPRRCFCPAELRECTKARVSSVTVIFFWKLDMFLRDYPTLWAAVWRKIPLSHLQKCDIRVCYYLVTQAGLKPERTEEERSRYSGKFLNCFRERSRIRGWAETVQPRTAPFSEPFSLLTKTIVWVKEQDANGCRTCCRMQSIDQICSCVLMQVRGLMWFWPIKLTVPGVAVHQRTVMSSFGDAQIFSCMLFMWTQIFLRLQ